MVIVEAQVTLLIKKNQSEYIETKVFAELYPTGRDENNTAGQKGFKAERKVEVWDFEYENQSEIIVNGKKLAIYRTYGPKPNGKIELYTGERAGKK